MQALNREQIPFFTLYHRKIHRGDYDGMRLSDLSYNPYASLKRRRFLKRYGIECQEQFATLKLAESGSQCFHLKVYRGESAERRESLTCAIIQGHMIETRKPVSLRWSEFHHEMLPCIQSKPNASPSEVAVLDALPVPIDPLLQKEHSTIRVVISEGDGLRSPIGRKISFKWAENRTASGGPRSHLVAEKQTSSHYYHNCPAC